MKCTQCEWEIATNFIIRNKFLCTSTQAGNVAVLEGSKCTNAFPSGPTRSLYAACPAFSKIVEFQSNKILNAMQYVIKKNHVRGNIQRFVLTIFFLIIKWTDGWMSDQKNKFISQTRQRWKVRIVAGMQRHNAWTDQHESGWAGWHSKETGHRIGAIGFA